MATARKPPAPKTPAAKPATRAASARRPSLKERTPLAEWTAAGLGLALTLAVLGYSLWEGVRSRDHQPSLSVEAAAAQRQPDGAWRIPIVVRNASDATAAQVQVKGRVGEEERTVTFAYVPGGGEVKGGLLFKGDPSAGLEVAAEGYEEP